MIARIVQRRLQKILNGVESQNLKALNVRFSNFYFFSLFP